MNPIDASNDFLTPYHHTTTLEEPEFISLSGGREYIRKYEVVGLRWSPYMTDENEQAWCLKVFFTDAPHSILYGDDARAAMRAFGLPTEPPKM